MHQTFMQILIAAFSSKKSVFILLLILFAVVHLSAQNTKTNKGASVKSKISKENFVIDKNKPSVYVEFVRLGEEPAIYASDSKERVYLKLVNNSKWSIFTSIFTYGNGEKTGLFYNVESTGSNNKKEVPNGYKRSDFGSPDSEIKSGKLISFSVPRNHLAENLQIRIKFEFDWLYLSSNRYLYEDSYSEPEMSVVFSSWSLERILKNNHQ